MDLEKQTKLEALWKKIDGKGSLPTLSSSMQSMWAKIEDPTTSPSEMVALIVDDYAMTQKVLRLANSAMYAPFGEVTTVSTALSILGMDTVGHLVLSLKLIDAFGDDNGSVAGKKELGKAIMASGIARNIAEKCNIQNTEEAAVCSMMHNTGRLLVSLYLAEEWDRISALGGGVPADEDAAAIRILGVSFMDLGVYAAEKWNLPVSIKSTLGDLTGAPKADDHSEWLKAVACASTEISRILTEPIDEEKVAETSQKYAEYIGVSVEEIRGTIEESKKENEVYDMLKDLEEKSTLSSAEKVQERLLKGMQAIQLAKKNRNLTEILNVATETMHTSFGFKRTLTFVLDPKSKNLIARIGFGRDTAGLLHKLAFGEAFSPDVFHLSIAKDMPIFIHNAEAEEIESKIPSWHKEALPRTKSFIVLPVVADKKTICLLYGDWGETAIHRKVEKQELDALRNLRMMLSQTIAQIRQGTAT